MRTYIAQELIGAIWVIGGMIAASEGYGYVAGIFLGMGLFYGLRAAVNYSRKTVEEENARRKT